MVAICYFQGNKAHLCGKVPITLHWWQVLCSILQVCLLLPRHHVSLDQGHWLGLLSPPALGYVSTDQQHQHLRLLRAEAQLWYQGFLSREHEQMNHSLEKEKLQAIKQGGKLKVCTFLSLLCLNCSLKSFALFFQVFLQLCWMSRAVVSQTSLKSNTLS